MPSAMPWSGVTNGKGSDVISSVSKEKFEDYDGFVEKFKPKKTTDDCYTPDSIYDCVEDYVVRHYWLDRSKFVRPFWPGGDFESYTYEEGSVVVDNPPFSIITKILRFYQERHILFFLFAPTLTGMNLLQVPGITFIAAGVSIEYENRATVQTSFVTNMEGDVAVRTDPGLYKALKEADRKNRAGTHTQMPKYEYPDNVLTAAMAQKYGHWGIDYRLHRGQFVFIRELDSQKAAKKGIYGGGLLLSEKAASEKAASEKAAIDRLAESKWEDETVYRWPLSERELEVIRGLA